jgi:DNA-directed RNA polymerase specialized sigma54-like protein
MKRKVDLTALRYVVEGIVASGRVVNGQALADLIGVNKGTISRNLRKIAVAFPTTAAGRSEGSSDDDPRCHDEIASQIRRTIAGEDPAKPYSDRLLIGLIDFRGTLRNLAKIRQKHAIPSSRERKVER